MKKFKGLKFEEIPFRRQSGVRAGAAAACDCDELCYCLFETATENTSLRNEDTDDDWNNWL
jgi:hypothetical protein